MPNALIFYRIARWFYLHKIPFIPKIFRAFIFIVYGCKIPYFNKIGKGTILVNGGMGVVIVEGTEIGEFCKIGVHVTFAGKSPNKECPKLGNRVYIGPGVVFSGNVIVEDDTIIAPNAVVVKSVPKGAIVGGVPAKIIGWVKDLDYDIFANENWKEGYADFLVEKTKGK